jgi:hypothetical protein
LALKEAVQRTLLSATFNHDTLKPENGYQPTQYQYADRELKSSQIMDSEACTRRDTLLNRLVNKDRNDAENEEGKLTRSKRLQNACDSPHDIIDSSLHLTLMSFRKTKPKPCNERVCYEIVGIHECDSCNYVTYGKCKLNQHVQTRHEPKKPMTEEPDKKGPQNRITNFEAEISEEWDRTLPCIRCEYKGSEVTLPVHIFIKH